MLRTICILLYLVIFLILSLPILLVEWIIGKFRPQVRDLSCLHIVQSSLKVVMALSGLKLTIIGKENIPTDQPVLYVGNHRSYFDIVVTYVNCPGLTGFIAKKELEKIPVINLWMKFLYCLLLDRTDIKAGLKTILAGIQQIKNGISIFVFPEGTRNKNEAEADLLPFHDGSFKLATKSGCPIIPVAIRNADQVFEAHLPRIKSTNVIIEYGKPIIVSELSKEDQRHIGEYTRNIMQQMLKRQDA